VSKSEGLDFLWNGKNKTLERLLFVTYSFNYTWFRNSVLPILIKSSSPNLIIDIIASDLEYEVSGTTYSLPDNYQIGEESKLAGNLRVFLIDSSPMVHTKIIMASYASPSGKSTFSLGAGSANLTPGGWFYNLEAWDWGCSYRKDELDEFFDFLTSKKSVPDSIFKYWKSVLTAKNGKPLLLPLDKKSKKETLDSYKKSLKLSSVEEVSIISPYYSNDLESVLSLFDFQYDKVPVNFLIDSSGKVASSNDLKRIDDLCKQYKNMSTYKLFKIHSENKDKYIAPLHAKLIEFKIGKKYYVLFGSANFTKQAWISGNYENIQSFKSTVSCLDRLVDEGYIVEKSNVTQEDIQKAEDSNHEKDRITELEVMWAVYREISRTIEVLLARNDFKISKFEIVSSSDIQKNSDEKSKIRQEHLNNINENFSNESNWKCEVKNGLVRLSFQCVTDDVTLDTPQRISLKLEFLIDGKKQTVTIPVYCVDFDYSKRSKETGIPLLFLDVMDAFEGGFPLIEPSISSFIDADDDEYEDEDEADNFEDIDALVDALEDESEFNHLSELLIMANKYRGIPQEHRDIVVKRLDSFLQKVGKENKRKAVLIKSFIAGVKNG